MRYFAQLAVLWLTMMSFVLFSLVCAIMLWGVITILTAFGLPTLVISLTALCVFLLLVSAVGFSGSIADTLAYRLLHKGRP